MQKTLDITGERYDRLIVQSKSERKDKYYQSYWNCKCDCGNIIVVVMGNLRNGNTKSCGCLKKDMAIIPNEKSFKHNMCYTPEYNAWSNLKSRCSNSNTENYINYGARGISVCDRWLNSFENFYTDMGPRPSNQHSIDRKNNDGNYEPGNCQWSTKTEQNNNRNNSNLINYNGETLSVSQLAKKYNINTQTLFSRLYKGLSIDEAINK